MLWTVKGTEAKAGSVVPVYLKSNITKQYVIGLSGSDERLELPLWQLEHFSSKRAAEERAKALASLASIYLVAERDGLPVRESPTNRASARRVYRMREGEMVKALGIVEGEAVYTGQDKLPGEWYYVLAKDGTRGYVFSYTLSIYDEASGLGLEESVVQPGDTRAVNLVFSKTWRPAWFSQMRDEGMVDLDYFSLRYGLFGDALNRQLRLELPNSSKVFNYTEVISEDGWLVFKGSELRIKPEGSSSLLVRWGADRAGEPEDIAGWESTDTSLRLTAMETETIRESIRAEEARKSAALRDFFASAQAAGAKPDQAGVYQFSSPFAGTLEFWPSGIYTWSDTLFLPAGFTPSAKESESGQKGSVHFGLRLAPELKSQWDGGFSLYPDDTGRRSDYAYALQGKNLVLAPLEIPAPGLASATLKTKLGKTSLDIHSGR